MSLEEEKRKFLDYLVLEGDISGLSLIWRPAGRTAIGFIHCGACVCTHHTNKKDDVFSLFSLTLPGEK